jgi:hypothetical protein
MYYLFAWKTVFKMPPEARENSLQKLVRLKLFISNDFFQAGRFVLFAE